MAGTIVVDRIESDGSYASTINVASKVNFTGGVQVGGQDATFGGMRNRIINGDMRIDQRNVGVTTTPADFAFITDRWQVRQSTASKMSAGQSTVVPVGFSNSLAITSLSSYTVLSSDIYTVRQQIEGFNTSDFGWGTANAKPVTLSFWVRSSLTGTFGGSALNNGNNRSYVFSYTINQADTWEYKTIIIPGDTTGTWQTNNQRGVQISFGLGVGSTQSGTAGAWSSNNYASVTGAVSLVGTNAATWYLTGVQLELGSVATSFEMRPYGAELALCQRYYSKSYNINVKPGTVSSYAGVLAVVPYSTGLQYTTWIIQFKQTMRTAPTVLVYSPETGASGNCYNGAGDVAAGASSIGESGCFARNTASASTGYFAYIQYTAEAEL